MEREDGDHQPMPHASLRTRPARDVCPDTLFHLSRAALLPAKGHRRDALLFGLINRNRGSSLSDGAILLVMTTSFADLPRTPTSTGRGCSSKL